MNIVKGKIAEQVFNFLIGNKTGKNYPRLAIAGYFRRNKIWIAFDNSTFECWTIEGNTKRQVRKWL